jgi:hypothetical protein
LNVSRMALPLHGPAASNPVASRSTRTRWQPRSNWWLPASRPPQRRGSSVSDGPPSIEKLAGQASSEAHSRPARRDHQVFRLSVGWRTTNAMPSLLQN